MYLSMNSLSLLGKSGYNNNKMSFFYINCFVNNKLN